ncbi:toxin-antitoxin system YwqK family antitoxin [Pedosphaera parvula]|uniref:MORN variant repeat protein n=1 Tax=Pedosphaera parvula (strain Ellin514) TaxID=320771 RepID=B9XMM8_PEDPL|nr:hypothetical protein [Pedosphaera parvula]EEF58927.1 hypothetical protein Cflav_PD2929 [Pedosphaera parvula Ellin514]
MNKLPICILVTALVSQSALAISQADTEERNDIRYAKNEQAPLEGMLEHYFEDGRIWEIYYYKQGKMNGEGIVFNRSGHLASRANYRNGKIHGKSTHWTDAGLKQWEQFYSDGELLETVFFDPAGKVTKREVQHATEKPKK